MEQATASSNAMEIQLQELHSNTLTRGREWLEGALEGISVLELRKMASARNVGRGPDKKWLAVGELRIQLLEVLAPATEVGCVKKRVLTKVVFSGSQQLMEVLVPPKEAWMRQNVFDPKLNVCHMVQCCRMGVVLWWQCVGCCRWMMRKLHWLPNWKNFA